MSYLVINITNYGIGYEPVGTYRSKKRAKKVQEALDEAADNNGEDSYHVIQVKPLDKYHDDIVVDVYKIKPGEA